jgi:hypothetical protein
VELVFGKLSLTYGHRFLSIWDGMPLAKVKADWAQQLAGVRDDRILWALQNLPERAPDAPTFRALCNRMPDPDRPLILPNGPKRPAPAVAKAFADAVKNAPAPTEPERVRWARSYIAKWTAPGAHPTFAEREALAVAQRIVARYDAQPVDIEQLKAAAQQKVDAYAQEGR